MSDVFISYSRKDSDFVAKLAAALNTAGRDAWVDVDGIRASENWKEKIFREIDAANTFLFVVSPDSIQSEVASEEVSHAALNSKRMIPLFYRNVENRKIPEALSRFQGIGFSDDGGFPAGVSALLHTLETDLEWVDAHTRLLIHAKDWEREGKDRSFLLRGKDLSEAEQMVARSASREPRLTALQSEYIFASRQLATKTQRVIIGATITALVIAIGLAAYAFVQKNKAVRNAHEAEARALAALSATNLTPNPELGILLAMQAVGATTRFGEPSLPAAEQALHDALFTSQLRRIYPGPGAPVQCARFSPDGRLIAMANNDGTIWLVDRASGRTVKTLPPHHADRQDVGRGWNLDRGRNLDFSPDGKQIAAGNEDGTASVWDLATGKEERVLPGHAGDVFSVAFYPDGRKLLTAGEDGHAILWNVSDGKKLLTIDAGSQIYAAVLSPQADIIATAMHGETLLWDASTGRRIAGFTANARYALSVAFSPDGNTLAVGLDNGMMQLWNTRTGQLVTQLRAHFNGVMGIAFSPDGKNIATTGWDGHPRIWNAENYMLVCEMRFHSEDIDRSYSAVFSNDGRSLLTSHQDGSVRLWKAGIGEELPSLDANPRVLHVAFSADSRDLAVSGETGFTLWGLKSGQKEQDQPCFDNAIGLAFSKDGKRVAKSILGDVAVCDLKTGNEIAMSGNDGAWKGLALTADGTRVAASDGLGGAAVWDASTGRQLWRKVDPDRKAAHDARVFADDAAFSPDGKLLATGSREGKLVLWDAATGERLSEVNSHKFSDGLWAVAFSPDGKRLASAGADGDVIVRDTSSRAPLLTIRTRGGTVCDLAFSPDGSRIATASADHRAYVWDARTGDRLSDLRGPQATVFAVAFSPDGKLLAAGYATGAVQLYAIDLHDLLRLARSRVTRELTPAECSYYLHEKTCPALPQ